MFLRIKNVLNATEVARLVELSRELRFVDGRISNPANQTKDNLQADPSDAKSAESSQLVQAALLRSREFVDFTMPKRIAAPLLARYEPGMKYGAHADAGGVLGEVGRVGDGHGAHRASSICGSCASSAALGAAPSWVSAIRRVTSSRS